MGYYETECMEAAKELISKNRNTLGKWITEKMQKHSNLNRENADYAFTGLLYQLFQFEPFSEYLGIDMKSGVVDERPARNLSILSSILGKYEYLHRMYTKRHMIDVHILPYFKERKVAEITPLDIKKWQNEIKKKGFSDTYLKTIHAQLCAIFNYRTAF